MQDSIRTEPSMSVDLGAPSMHARRAVRPTSLGNGGEAGVIGEGASEQSRLGDRSARNDPPYSSQQTQEASNKQSVEQPSHDTAVITADPISHGPATSQPTLHTVHTTPPRSRSARVPNLSELADGSPHQIQGEVTLPLPLEAPIGSYSEDFDDEAFRNVEMWASQESGRSGADRAGEGAGEGAGDESRHEVIERSGGLSPQFALHAAPHGHVHAVPHPVPHPVHYSTHAQPVPNPHVSHEETHYHLPLSPDHTGQRILRCLHERIEKLARKYETARAQEILHPLFGVAMNPDGTSKAYVDVSILNLIFHFLSSSLSLTSLKFGVQIILHGFLTSNFSLIIH